MQEHAMDTLLALAGIAIFAIAVTYFEAKSHKKRIRACMSERGATDIAVSWQWAWGDKLNSIYTVDYTNRKDERCQIICKVAHFSGDIYWSEPPEV
jgi:hypothetical protein